MYVTIEIQCHRISFSTSQNEQHQPPTKSTKRQKKHAYWYRGDQRPSEDGVESGSEICSSPEVFQAGFCVFVFHCFLCQIICSFPEGVVKDFGLVRGFKFFLCSSPARSRSFACTRYKQGYVRLVSLSLRETRWVCNGLRHAVKSPNPQMGCPPIVSGRAGKLHAWNLHMCAFAHMCMHAITVSIIVTGIMANDESTIYEQEICWKYKL